MMGRNVQKVAEFAPAVLLRFPIRRPQRLMKLADKEEHEPAATADKLRLYRSQCGLSQREAAARIGVGRHTYMRYEEAAREYYPAAVMDKLAALYGVSVEMLFDVYHLFLRCGQGRQLRTLREAHELTQEALAAMLSVSVGTVKNWESGRVRIARADFERVRKLFP